MPDTKPLLAAPLATAIAPADLYLRSLSPGSRPTMRQALTAIAQRLGGPDCDASSFDWAALRYPHLAALQADLIAAYEPATVKKMLAACKRVLAEAKRLKLMAAEDYAEAIDLPPIRDRARQLKGRALSRAEIAALLQVCQADPSSQGRRDAALIAILRGAGLRRAEVVKLELADFDPTTGALQVRRGKGNQDRTVYLPSSAIALVETWLETRGRDPGPLLLPIRKGGRLQQRALSAQAVLLILQKRAAAAGLAAFSPHDFRRTFCSDLLEAGVDIATVQKLAGHATPLTTARYDRRGEAAKRRAVEHLDL